MTGSDAGTDGNSDRRERLVPAALGLSRVRAVLWVVALGLLATVAFVAWRYVGTVVLGLFVYYVTRPVFGRIHARVRSRTLAVVVSLLLVALPVLVLVGWTLVVAYRSLSDLFDGSQQEIAELLAPYVNLSAVVGNVRSVVTEVLADPSRLGDVDLGPVLTGATEAVLSSVGVLVNVAIHGFVVLVIAFYLLRDDHRLARWARATFTAEGSVVEAYVRAVDRDLKNVYFGNILNALVTGLLAAVTFVVLNTVAPAAVTIPEAGLLGLLVGAASLVPVIGIKLVTVPLAAYLFGRSLLADPGTLWFPVLFVVVSFVVVDYVPDQLLRPYVSGRTLHVGAVMLAYTLGPLLFGWYGIFLGPLVLVLVFEFGRVLLPWLVDPERTPTAGPVAADEAGADVEGVPAPEDAAPDQADVDAGETPPDGDDPAGE